MKLVSCNKPSYSSIIQAMSSDRNYSIGGVSNGTTIVVIVSTLTALSEAFFAARLFVRIKLMRSIGLDDYLIVLVMVRSHTPMYS
jgi:hypothetical protein